MFDGLRKSDAEQSENGPNRSRRHASGIERGVALSLHHGNGRHAKETQRPHQLFPPQSGAMLQHGHHAAHEQRHGERLKSS